MTTIGLLGGVDLSFFDALNYNLTWDLIDIIDQLICKIYLMGVIGVIVFLVVAYIVALLSGFHEVR